MDNKISNYYDNVGGIYEGAAVLNNTIYNLNIEMDTFSQYNPTTNTWTQKKSAALKYEVPPVVAALNGNIHAFIRISYLGNESNFHKCYNPATDTWTSKANLPAGIYATDTDAAVSNGHMYVITNAGNQYCYVP